MNKTQNPENYLNYAEKIVRSMYESKVWGKLNILLYPKETENTIKETKDWLTLNKKYYKGISASPFILYLNGKYTQKFIHNTGILPNYEFLYSHGYTYIDLSSEIDANKAKKVCNDIFYEYMGRKNYEDLKSICYTSI